MQMRCAVSALCGLIHAASESGPHLFTTMRTSQITRNLTFSVQIRAPFYAALNQIKVRFPAIRTQSEQSRRSSCNFYVTLDRHLSQFSWQGGPCE